MPQTNDCQPCNKNTKSCPWLTVMFVIYAVGAVVFGSRIIAATYGVGVNHTKIQIRCFDKAGEVMLEHTAYAPDNIYHDFFSGGYRFKDDKGTTVVSKDVDCMLIITPKNNKEEGK